MNTFFFFCVKAEIPLVILIPIPFYVFYVNWANKRKANMKELTFYITDFIKILWNGPNKKKIPD